jgi:hypothetical protein
LQCFFGVLSGGSLSASVEEVKACQLLSVQWLDAEAAIGARHTDDPNLTSPTSWVCALQGISHTNKNPKFSKIEVLILRSVI